MEPTIHILTRTCNRPNAFSHLFDRVRSQRYPHLNHWIICDDPESKYVPDCTIRVERPPRIHKHHFPYNIYLNMLVRSYVPRGPGNFVMVVDDDDTLVSLLSVCDIAEAVVDDNTMVLWKMEVWGETVKGRTSPSDEDFGKTPEPGKIGNPCCLLPGWVFDYHLWDEWRGADGRLYRSVYQEPNINPVWLPKVITKMQGTFERGSRKDIPA